MIRRIRSRRFEAQNVSKRLNVRHKRNEGVDVQVMSNESIDVSDIKISDGQANEFRINSKYRGDYIALGYTTSAEILLRTYNQYEFELSSNEVDVVLKLRIDPDMEDEIKEISDEVKDRWADVSSLWISSRRLMDGTLSALPHEQKVFTIEVNDVDETIEVEGVEFEVTGVILTFDGDEAGITYDELVAVLNDEL